MRQTTEAISAFFDTSNGNNINSGTIERSGHSSSSASETGDEHLPGLTSGATCSLVDDEGLMAEIGCCSPNWDPFALSSSQSSDADSTSGTGTELDGSVPTRNDVMSMSCSPVLSTNTARTSNGKTVCVVRFFKI